MGIGTFVLELLRSHMATVVPISGGILCPQIRKKLTDSLKMFSVSVCSL